MTALPAHPAIRLPIGRLAPIVVGVGGASAGVMVVLATFVRPGEVGTAVVGGGSVVLAAGAMYALLATIRVRHLLSLTTILMAVSMARLLLSVGIGLAYMLTAVTPTGGRPDKFVFAVAFLGTSLAVIAVETVLLRRTIHDLAADLTPGIGGSGKIGEGAGRTESDQGPASGGGDR